VAKTTIEAAGATVDCTGDTVHRYQRPAAERIFADQYRPAKAGVFSGRHESHRGKSQEPRSLNRIHGGNEMDGVD
jgi:hypothetical protein